jgi:hypothetical protein
MGSENQKPVRPWDLFNKNMNRVPASIKEERLKICKQCPFYRKNFDQCKKCGCIMTQKTKLADAFCPVHKWGVYSQNIDNPPYHEEIADE